MTDDHYGKNDIEFDDSKQISQSLCAVHDRLGTVGIRLNEAHAHLSALRCLSHNDKKIHADVANAEAEALVCQLETVQKEVEATIDLAMIAASSIKNTGETDSTRDLSSEDIPQMLWNTNYDKITSSKSGTD